MRQHRSFHIFLSYRREGTSAHAHRLRDHLLSGVDEHPGFSEDQVFTDVDTIQPGDDFREAIREAVARCDVFLAVIGRQWSDARDAEGGRRLENPGDHVRLEIETALQRKVPVVPLLVDGAQMPSEGELPQSMAELSYRHAIELNDTRWRHDVGRLLTALKKRETAQQPATPHESAPSRDADRSTRTTSVPELPNQRHKRGERLRTGSRLQVTKLLKLTTGKEVNCVRFTSEGNRIVTGEDDGFVRVFDLADPSGPVRELRFKQWGIGMGVLGLDVAHSAPHIACVGQSSKLQVIDYETSAQRANFVVSNLVKGCFGVAFGADDSKIVATAGEDGTARIWNWQTAKEILRLEHDTSVHAVTFATGGLVIASAEREGKAHIWNSQTGDRLASIDHEEFVRDVAADINGDIVATASLDGSCSIWDARQRREITRIAGDVPVFCVAVSAVDHLLCTGCFDGTVTIWQLKGDAANVVSRMSGNGEPIFSVALSPEGTHAAAGGKDGALEVWQIEG